MPVTYLDPRGEVSGAEEPYDLGTDVTRSPATLALLSNGFPDSKEFMDEVERVLTRLLPQARIVRFGKPNPSIPADAALLEAISKESDAAITAYGH